MQCAWAARKTPTFLGHTFRRLEARIGGKRAAVAVGHKMLVIVYHLLWQGTYDEEQRYADQRPQQEERDGKRAITALKPPFRITHISLRNFWVPIQSLLTGGDYATLVPP